MSFERDEGANPPTMVATAGADFGDAGASMSDLERQVAANGKTGRGASGGNDVHVAKRHGIWTVSKGGVFVGDYHDPEAAIAAAAQAQDRENKVGEDVGMTDPWQRSEKEERP
jgi:hypothetical protein